MPCFLITRILNQAAQPITWYTPDERIGRENEFPHLISIMVLSIFIYTKPTESLKICHMKQASALYSS